MAVVEVEYVVPHPSQHPDEAEAIVDAMIAWHPEYGHLVSKALKGDGVKVSLSYEVTSTKNEAEMREMGERTKASLEASLPEDKRSQIIKRFAGISVHKAQNEELGVE